MCFLICIKKKLYLTLVQLTKKHWYVIINKLNATRLSFYKSTYYMQNILCSSYVKVEGLIHNLNSFIYSNRPYLFIFLTVLNAGFTCLQDVISYSRVNKIQIKCVSLHCRRCFSKSILWSKCLE